MKAIVKPVHPYLRERTPGEHVNDYLTQMEITCHNLEINPNWLWLVIQSESGHNAKARNPYAGAVGLIQFMPATAQHLGTSTESLYEMSRWKQMTWVEKYYKLFSMKPKSYFDLYLLTFYPYAADKPDSYVFGSERSDNWAKKVATQNPFDYNHDGLITKAEFKEFAYRKHIKGLIPKRLESEIL